MIRTKTNCQVFISIKRAFNQCTRGSPVASPINRWNSNFNQYIPLIGGFFIMKINFQTSGGFAHLPALNKPFLVDTAQIDPETAHQLESFVRESRFFDQPAQVSNAAKGAADYKTYTISIEDGARAHTLKISEPIKDEQLQKLVAHLRNLSRSSNEVKRP